MLQTFTGTQYLKIDIANHFGMDRESWETRLLWVNMHETTDTLEDQVVYAEDPILFAKAVHTLRLTESGDATGYIRGLDASASGYQPVVASLCSLW